MCSEAFGKGCRCARTGLASGASTRMCESVAVAVSHFFLLEGAIFRVDLNVALNRGYSVVDLENFKAVSLKMLSYH